jgi:hypothetical protein
MPSQCARVTLILWLLAFSIGTAQAADPTEAERRASSAALSLMHRTGFLQIPVNRQAIAETTLDDPLKKQIDTIFVRMESDLRPLIAGVQTNPDSVDSLIKDGRKIVAAAQDELRKLVTDDQYDQLARRTRLVQIQLMAITAGPHTFDEARAALQLNADQQKKMDALLNSTGTKVRKLTDALTSEEQMVPSAEQLVTVAVDARKQLRAMLNEDQLKKLDESTNTALTDPPPASRRHD